MTDNVERLRDDTQMLWDAVAEKNAEIERLLRVCRDKTQLLADAYAQIERLRAALDEQVHGGGGG